MLLVLTSCRHILVYSDFASYKLLTEAVRRVEKAPGGYVVFTQTGKRSKAHHKLAIATDRVINTKIQLITIEAAPSNLIPQK